MTRGALKYHGWSGDHTGECLVEKKLASLNGWSSTQMKRGARSARIGTRLAALPVRDSVLAKQVAVVRYHLMHFKRAVLEPLLPTKVRRVKRVDDRRVLNGILWSRGRERAGAFRRVLRIKNQSLVKA